MTLRDFVRLILIDSGLVLIESGLVLIESGLVLIETGLVLILSRSCPGLVPVLSWSSLVLS